MLKDEWRFDYTAAKVADAARAKIAYHESRLAFWMGKREEIIATIRAEGIEVDEKIVLAQRHLVLIEHRHGHAGAQDAQGAQAIRG